MGINRAAPAEFEIGWEYDRPGEECGNVAMWFNERGHDAIRQGEIDPYELLYDALLQQANRGKQNTGAGASIDGINFDVVTGVGKPEIALEEGRKLDELPQGARYFLGHNRYTTLGGQNGAQPVYFHTRTGDMVLVGNGEFSNHRDLAIGREDLPSDYWVWGSRVADEIDTGFTMAAAMMRTARISEGAYSIVGMHNSNMVLMRDPHGIRPLHFGPMADKGWASASEKPTLEKMGVPAHHIKEVGHGEIVIVNDEGITNLRYADTDLALCALEKIYISRILDPTIRDERYQSGVILAEEAPADADVVVPIMGSAEIGSRGFGDALGIPVDTGVIVKKPGVNRNYMELTPEERDLIANPKHDHFLERIEGKRVVVGEDSVLRGDTMRGNIAPITEVADVVDIRVFSPTITNICNLGVAHKKRMELIFNRMSRDAFVESLLSAQAATPNIRSYEHLSLEGLVRAYGKDLCTGCFTGGQYPALLRPTVNDQAIRLASR